MACKEGRLLWSGSRKRMFQGIGCSKTRQSEKIMYLNLVFRFLSPILADRSYNSIWLSVFPPLECPATFSPPRFQQQQVTSEKQIMIRDQPSPVRRTDTTLPTSSAQGLTDGIIYRLSKDLFCHRPSAQPIITAHRQYTGAKRKKKFKIKVGNVIFSFGNIWHCCHAQHSWVVA